MPYKATLSIKGSSRLFIRAGGFFFGREQSAMGACPRGRRGENETEFGEEN